MSYRRSMSGGFGFSQSEKDWMKNKASAAKSSVSGALGQIRRGSSSALSSGRDRFHNWQDKRTENKAVNSIMRLKDAQRRAAIRDSIRSSSFSSGGRRKRSKRHSRKRSSRRRHHTRKRSSRKRKSRKHSASPKRHRRRSRKSRKRSSRRRSRH